MLSLSRILLRYCQSAIVALALCLVPEVEASLAQSVRDLTSDLDIWVSQELILPSAAAEVDLMPGQSAPESSHTPEFSESLDFSSAEATEESDVIPSPRLSPEHFLSQPTISSQLLLPPGEESVQLLLAPTPETSQLFLPAATETQLLLPAAPDTEQTDRISRVAPITSQRFLPAATMPVGLLSPAQDSPAVNPLTIVIQEAQSREISLGSSVPQESVQEQVGRTLARTTIQSQSASNPGSGGTADSATVTPRSTPALLPASTIPRTPLRRSPQSEAFTSRQTSEFVSLAASRESVNADIPLQTSPVKDPRDSNRSVSPPQTPAQISSEPQIQSSDPSSQTDLTSNNDGVTSEPSAVASREIGVTVAPEATDPPWLLLPRNLLAALGGLLLLLLGLLRWIGGGQAPIAEEIDWANLPRSKPKVKSTLPPVSPKLKQNFSRLLQHVDILANNSVAPLNLAPPVVPSETSSFSVTQTLPDSKETSAVVPPQPEPQSQRSRPFLPLEDPEQFSLPDHKQKKQGSFALQNSDIGLWITIALIGFIGLAAWLIQFYGLI
ncbi:MAG: hypothetical protein ACO31I_04910 [Prochlorotrichaceae cyanobacterium]|jgi:hypothetical protein